MTSQSVTSDSSYSFFPSSEHDMRPFKNKLQARIAALTSGCVLALLHSAAQAAADADDPAAPPASIGAAATMPAMTPIRGGHHRGHRKELHLAPPAAPQVATAPLAPVLRLESEAQKKARLGR
jgi:hypothetical protein